MNIKLPKKFYYTTSETSCAYVADGILYIKGYVNFEALMYTLTYTIYGYEKCRYCGSTISNEERTLDHIYPRGYGGVSITDNLLPCCIPCNQSKMDMAPYQFTRWKTFDKPKERRDYYRKCIKENCKRTLNGKFILPRRWIEEYEISKLQYDCDLTCIEQSQLDKINDYYETNHQYSHPIVVSSNNWLLKGMPIAYHAIIHDKKTMSAIVLKNVVVIRDAR